MQSDRTARKPGTTTMRADGIALRMKTKPSLRRADIGLSTR
ncbi:MAG: hypothetical protein ACPGFC_11020 [Paracoccaceae bacterium]